MARQQAQFRVPPAPGQRFANGSRSGRGGGDARHNGIIDACGVQRPGLFRQRGNFGIAGRVFFGGIDQRGALKIGHGHGAQGQRQTPLIGPFDDLGRGLLRDHMDISRCLEDQAQFGDCGLIAATDHHFPVLKGEENRGMLHLAAFLFQFAWLAYRKLSLFPARCLQG